MTPPREDQELVDRCKMAVSTYIATELDLSVSHQRPQEMADKIVSTVIPIIRQHYEQEIEALVEQLKAKPIGATAIRNFFHDYF
jgi:hypothetical protein